MYFPYHKHLEIPRNTDRIALHGDLFRVVGENDDKVFAIFNCCLVEAPNLNTPTHKRNIPGKNEPYEGRLFQ